MPIARFQMPDGRIARFEVQEGTTPEQAQSLMQQYVSGGSAKQSEASSKLERFGSGLADPVWGAMQVAAHVVPGVDSGIVDQMVKDREEEYAAKRKAAGSEGVDWMRLGGNIVNPINFAGGAGAARAASLGGRIAAGATTGAASSLLSPVTDNTENFGTEKLKQAATGAATGGAVPVAAAGIGRVISPQTSEAVKDLIDKGITPTLGQHLGGVANTWEQKLSSVPIVGDVIASARRGSIDDMNRSIYNMALEPIGERSTQPIGRKGVREVADKLSNRYDQILQGKTINVDPQFRSDLMNIKQAVFSVASPNAREQFWGIVKNAVMGDLENATQLDGALMKKIDSQLGEYSRKFGKDRDINNQMVGEGLDLIQQKLRDAVARANPQLADEVNKVNQGWAFYTRLRNAASKSGSKEGIVSPAAISSAVRLMDNTVGKGGTAGGNGFMRKFADEAESVLGSNYPDSGTAGRYLLSLLLYGGGMHFNPASMLLSAPMTLPYLPGVKKAVSVAMTARPQGAHGAANAVKGAAQYAIPGISENAMMNTPQQ